MSGTSEDKDRLWRRLVGDVDNWLLPVTLGCCTMLVVTQVVTSIPSVRNLVDGGEGRFISMPADVVPSSVQHESAVISLFASPEGNHADVKVLVNNQEIGSLDSDKLDVQVREGDLITIANTGSNSVVVVVNHDNPNLLIPAPGQTLTLNGGDRASLPTARFSQ